MGVSGPPTLKHVPALLSAANWPALLGALDETAAQVMLFSGPHHQVAYQNRASVLAVGPKTPGEAARHAFAESPGYVLQLDEVYVTGKATNLLQSPVPGSRPPTGAPGSLLIDATFAPLRDTAGDVWGVMWQGVDVTGRLPADERLRVATALNRASLDLSRSLEVEQVTANVTRLAAEVFSGWGLLDLWQADGTLKRVAVTHHDPKMQPLIEELKSLPRISGRPDRSEPYSARVARTGEVAVGQLDLAALVGAASSAEHARLMQALRPKWFISVPVQIGARRLGALSVVRPQGEEPFDPSDRAVVEQFAERAAIALAHARDYDEQRQAALTLQRNLLPAQPAKVDGVELVARYQAGGPSSEVGGDWYDSVAMPGGSVGVAVGDVQGHDLAAAALMGQVRAVVHSHAHLGLPPARIAEEANAFVVEAPGESLVTLTFLQVYPEEHLVVWSRAGHLPALLATGDGEVKVLLGRGGLPLGVSAEASWQEETLHLPVGAVLAAFTDGLVESPSRGFDEGVTRLARVLQGRAGEDLDALADDVLAQLSRDGAPQDDVALVLLRLRPADQPRLVEPDGAGPAGAPGRADGADQVHRTVSRRLPADTDDRGKVVWFELPADGPRPAH